MASETDNSPTVEGFPVTYDHVLLIQQCIENDATALNHWMRIARTLQLSPADIYDLKGKERRGESIRVIIAQTLDLWITKNGSNATLLNFLSVLIDLRLRRLKDELMRSFEAVKKQSLQ